MELSLNQAKEMLMPWFFKNDLQILEKFASLDKNSVCVLPKDKDFSSVFVPGTRKDRALLVAHVDTVWHDRDIVVDSDGVLKSGNRKRVKGEDGRMYLQGNGIGADDRAGVAILWEMRGLGHSLLLVNGEESGCLGSSHFMGEEDRTELAQAHQFAVEFDRNGRNDLVYYNIGSKKFQKYCSNQMPGYSTSHGSFTDICVLCEEICGVNISVGYKNEHTPNEILNARSWARTLATSFKWLSGNLPKFKQNEE